jgi:hypothetical protein
MTEKLNRGTANRGSTEHDLVRNEVLNCALTDRKHGSYLRLARALAPELVLELPELLEDEVEREVDPELELWDELDPLDDRELLSDELEVNNNEKGHYFR